MTVSTTKTEEAMKKRQPTNHDSLIAIKSIEKVNAAFREAKPLPEPAVPKPQ